MVPPYRPHDCNDAGGEFDLSHSSSALSLAHLWSLEFFFFTLLVFSVIFLSHVVIIVLLRLTMLSVHKVRFNQLSILTGSDRRSKSCFLL